MCERKKVEEVFEKYQAFVVAHYELAKAIGGPDTGLCVDVGLILVENLLACAEDTIPMNIIMAKKAEQHGLKTTADFKRSVTEIKAANYAHSSRN